MAEITDAYMHEQLSRSRIYTVAFLRPGPQYAMEGRDELVWEHGRRNFELRAAGKLVIVGPVPDESDLSGMGIFAATTEETAAILAVDPAVAAGIFVVELHPFRSFPGDGLPE